MVLSISQLNFEKQTLILVTAIQIFVDCPTKKPPVSYCNFTNEMEISKIYQREMQYSETMLIVNISNYSVFIIIAYFYLLSDQVR